MASPSSNKLVGIQPVLEAFQGKTDVDKVFIQKGLNSDKVKEIRAQAKGRGVPVSIVPVEKLNRLSGGTRHQGVCCFLSAITYSTAEFIIDSTIDKGEAPFLVLLDEITDVRNMGSIARSCEAAGVHGLIVPSKGAAPINEESMKASAGALHHVPVARVKSLINTVKMCQDYGITVVCATEKANKDIFFVDLKGPIALVVGNEETGISEDILRFADQHVKLPMSGQIGSLNVSNAATVCMYEVVRQKLMD